MPPAIARLRGDFIFRSEDGHGPHRPIDVSLASPDFIALRDVPPLALLRSGHRTIADREPPQAGSSASRIALMCSGVLPQHPPTIVAPATCIAAAWEAIMAGSAR